MLVQLAADTGLQGPPDGLLNGLLLPAITRVVTRVVTAQGSY